MTECNTFSDFTHIRHCTVPKIHKVVSNMIPDFEGGQKKLYFFNLQPRVAQLFESLRNLTVLYDMNSLEIKLSGKEEDPKEYSILSMLINYIQNCNCKCI